MVVVLGCSCCWWRWRWWQLLILVVAMVLNRCCDASLVSKCGCFFPQVTMVEDRYTPRMGPELEKGWRKSSQWKMLVRKHAQIVVLERKIYPVFAKHCYTADEDPDLKRSVTALQPLHKKSVAT
jgi:hypothetical protein